MFQESEWLINRGFSLIVLLLYLLSSFPIMLVYGAVVPLICGSTLLIIQCFYRGNYSKKNSVPIKTLG